MYSTYLVKVFLVSITFLGRIDLTKKNARNALENQIAPRRHSESVRVKACKFQVVSSRSVMKIDGNTCLRFRMHPEAFLSLAYEDDDVIITFIC